MGLGKEESEAEELARIIDQVKEVYGLESNEDWGESQTVIVSMKDIEKDLPPEVRKALGNH